MKTLAPKSIVIFCFAITMALCSRLSYCAEPLYLDSLPAVIKHGIKGTLVAQYSFKDKLGLHILALSQDTLESEETQILLYAQQYLFARGKPRREWLIRDFQKCPGLDIEGTFLSQLTSFTDLDSNEITESTVVYQLLCAGDVQPKTVKAIMRQGSSKYAIRGKSVVNVPGMSKEGGEYEMGVELKNHKRFGIHLLATWKKGAGVETLEP